MRVHAAPVVGEEGFRHECDGLAMRLRHIANDVFVQHHVIRRLQQGVEALVDFALPARSDFVVVALDVQAAPDHGFHHLAPQILVVVRGRYREITFFIPGPVAEVVSFAAAVPPSFFGVDEIKAAVLVLIEADIVENEELGFRAKIGSVADAAVLQIQLGLARDPARIAIIVLARDRIHDVADHNQGRNLVERIHERRGRVRNQQHVALVDRRPAADARSIHAETVLE